MIYTETSVKNYLRKNCQHIDSWFCDSYQASPYKGCAHNCAYGDGRSESYYYDDRFGQEIEIKANAAELFPKEIKTLKEPGYIFVGSGITDPYQPIEAKYRLIRQTLQTILKTDLGFPLPVHILTKGKLVEDDLPLIAKIAQKSGAILSFSIASDDEKTREWMEPGAALLADRYRILSKAKKMGIATGIMLIPTIPFISDSERSIESIVKKGKEAKVDFILFGGLTLKPGKQKTYYLNELKKHRPDAVEPTENLYADCDFWGNAKGSYYTQINNLFTRLIQKSKIPFRIPHALLKNKLPLYVQAALLLSHLADYLGVLGKPRYNLHKVGAQIQLWAYNLKKGQMQKKDFDYRNIEAEFRQKVLSGEIKNLDVSAFAVGLLQELVETGTVNLYQKLTNYRYQ